MPRRGTRLNDLFVLFQDLPRVDYEKLSLARDLPRAMPRLTRAELRVRLAAPIAVRFPDRASTPATNLHGARSVKR